MRRIIALIALPLCASCTSPGTDVGGLSAGGTEGTSDDSTSTSNETSTSLDSSGDSGEETGSDTDTEGPIFDVGDGDGDGDGDGKIPETCDEAETIASTVGCRFYPVDIESFADAGPYAVAVGNPQEMEPANVVIERKVDGEWMIEQEQDIAELDLFTFELPDNAINGNGQKEGGAYRISADVPVVAYQFNPYQGEVHTSDASMLYPVHTWDTLDQVVGYAQNHGTRLTIAAAHDGTELSILTTADVNAFGSYPATAAGEVLEVVLDEGDTVSLRAAFEQSFTGTEVSSNKDHPVGVFSSHVCATIGAGACDHLEEQLSGLRRWGKAFVAARMPVRDVDAPEETLWQVYASVDATEITISASADVTGLPDSPFTLDKGDVVSFLSTGIPDDPGHLVVEATEPIAVINYMTGYGNIPDAWMINNPGDPAMLQHAPVDQFLPRYVVLAPPGYMKDYATITRPKGVEVLLDGDPVVDMEFLPVGPDYEIAIVTISDGVHVLESEEPFGVIITGTHIADSFSYLGGTGTKKINPLPEG